MDEASVIAEVPWELDEGAAEVIWTAFRPGYLVALFVAGWATNVAVFGQFRVDYCAVLGVARDEIVSPWRLWMLTSGLAVSLLLFRYTLPSTAPPAVVLQSVLALYALGFCGLFAWLPPVVARQVRWRIPLARALWRCLCPDGTKEVPFVEVLVADGLTSMAKVFFDLTVGSCVAVSTWGGPPRSELFSLMLNVTPEVLNSTAIPSPTPVPQRSFLGDALAECKQSPAPFLAWASPFLIRARQCIVTARHAPDTLSRHLQLVNLLKYLTALPVIAASFCHVRTGASASAFVLEAEDFEALWALAAVVNSIFSFLWDLVMDWGLLQSSAHFGLRPVLLFRGVWGFYHVAIVCNLLGRTLWSLRWSPQATLFLGGFFLASFQQGAEVLRRCLWNVIRVEWECIKKGVHRADKHFSV